MLQRCTILLLSFLLLAFCAVTTAGSNYKPACVKKCKNVKPAIVKKDNYKARYWLLPGMIKH